jgi:low temperature requirement protein LtrA
MKRININNLADYDERELSAIGDVFGLTFGVAVGIMFLNAVLAACGIIWASTEIQFFLSAVVSFAFYAVIASLHGVFLGGKLRLLQPIVALAVTVVCACVSLCMYSRGNGFICHDSGVLTYAGAGFITGVLFLLVSVCMFIEYFRDKKAGSDLFEEEGR